ncbi:MAG: hypothetical protein J6M53_08345 [Bacteroidaceae bacterium]|nr:hypothetical protein [Bacteroidaceae bacterium]
MKHFAVLILLLCCCGVLRAQDVIVKKDGTTVLCRVVELNTSEIVYKKWTDLAGSNYVMNRADASSINYENGKKVDLSELSNLYGPGNQNDGTARLNDNALLQLDYQRQHSASPDRAVKRWRTAGYVIGGIFLAGGVAEMVAVGLDGHTGDMVYGLGVWGVGAGVSALCFAKANRLKKQTERLQAATLYEESVTFAGGSRLSAGVDLLNDHATRTQTLGLGLRFSF